ncbi:MAG: sialidase family protein [Chloroflexi bacterium]|nr:sialidase family protein [Chloroflexota bacterium]MXV93428.1 exo-alpha-sialidase [Chloroflexota bacterium]MXX50306.1 exo-alpha-sialidase [Chloroflexota bacterium]MYA94146.1 exo-alpha-sialidase [Chloroflexota bacterium]MYC55631.1 exo-alpha-sialidase [Chloroflexota bacterium]
MTWSEVKYQPELSKTYLGSPSILRLPDGALLASHDYFGLPNCPKNHENEESLTSIYRSEDEGDTWSNITHIMNCYWSSLFAHRGSVYIFGVSQQYGSIVIRRSDDGGFTWTHPADSSSGLLFPGGAFRQAPNYHCAPMPVLEHDGRLYKAFEDADPPRHGPSFHSCVVSAPVDANLLEAANWTISNKIPFDPAWIPAEWDAPERPCWLEGNVVVSPSGELWNILRLNAKPMVNRAAIVNVLDGGRRIAFEPGGGFIDFPGGGSKFTIRYDDATGKYLALVNNVTNRAWHSQRNILSLSISEDLINWRIVRRLMADRSGLTPEDSARLTGFQYVDWQFDGDDIMYLVRTAYRGAIRYHDSNRIIFRKLRDFRALL